MVERAPNLHSSTRILKEWGIPTSYLEAINSSTFELLPDNVSQYMNGGIFILIGAGSATLELGDFKEVVRRLEPSYAVFLTPPWLVDRTDPDTWSDSFKNGFRCVWWHHNGVVESVLIGRHQSCSLRGSS